MLVGLAATACGTGEQADAPQGDCPVKPVRVVATVNQWGEIVEALGGDCVAVDTIISGSAADPHDYEPSPADSAAFEQAQLAVLNGLGYDSWAQRALDQLGDDGPEVIDAGKTNEVVGKMRVSALLESLPGVGRVRARQIMQEVGISESRRVRGLGQNQAAALIERFGR